MRETTGQCGSVLLFPVVSGLFLQKKKNPERKSPILIKILSYRTFTNTKYIML